MVVLPSSIIAILVKLIVFNPEAIPSPSENKALIYIYRPMFN